MGFQPGTSASGSFYTRPSSSFGYWRGSGTNAGITGLGGNMPNTSSGIFTAPGTTTPGGWSPSVLYLLLLIIAEMFVFGFIARTLR
jgi:hypothetical protein